MASNDLLRMCQDHRARTNGHLSVLSPSRFTPIAANVVRIIQVYDVYIHITLKIPFTQAAIVRISAQLPLIKWFDDDVAAFQLFHYTLVGK